MAIFLPAKTTTMRNRIWSPTIKQLNHTTEYISY